MTKRFLKSDQILLEKDKRKSLQELEGENWGDGDHFPSYLVRTCHRLRRKPLCDFTIEDLRNLQPHLAFLNYFPLPETWDITIRGPSGHGEPIFNDEQVAFNGDEATGNDTESFVIELSDLYEAKIFQFCKTSHDPYDLPVIAALVGDE